MNKANSRSVFLHIAEISCNHFLKHEETMMHTPENIFITDGFPTYTYVQIGEGLKEKDLREGLEQKNKIISISGPSKSGKTTLVDHVFGKDQGYSRLYVTGDSISKPEDLWFEAYRQITDDTDKSFHELSHGERMEKVVQHLVCKRE